MRVTQPAGDPWFLRPGRHVLHYNDFVSHREQLYALLQEGRITVDVDWNQGSPAGCVTRIGNGLTHVTLVAVGTIEPF